MIIYFSTLKGKSVIDVQNRLIGKLEDIIIKDGEKFADVTYLLIKNIQGKQKLSVKYVDSLDRHIFLNATKEELKFEPLDGSEILIGNQIVDRQLIDIDGLKVIRVNDIVLAKIQDKISLVSVDTSLKGFIRRLGLNIPFMRGNQNMIPWEFVEPLSSDKELKLKVSRQKVSKLHPADIAHLLEELSPKERASFLGSLDDTVAAQTLAEAEPEIKKSVSENIKTLRIASVLEKMPIDEALDVLSLLPKERETEILKITSKEFNKLITKRMGYSVKSAGRMMSPDFISVKSDESAQKTIDSLRELMPKSSHAFYIYVTDENQKLVGVLSLRELIGSAPEKKISEIMNTNVIKVYDDTAKDEATKIVIKYNLLVLPVIDKDEKLVGVITMDDVLSNVAPRSLKKRTRKQKRMQKKGK